MQIFVLNPLVLVSATNSTICGEFHEIKIGDVLQ